MPVQVANVSLSNTMEDLFMNTLRPTRAIDLDFVLDHVLEAVEPFFGKGRLPEYIPALAAVDPRRFGMAVVTVNGDEHIVGDADEPFSIQSISKLFALVLAMNIEGETLWSHVGREPSGTHFNSLVQLEYDRGVPRNPFINAGALVTVDRVLTHVKDYASGLLRLVRIFCADSPNFDPVVMESERDGAHVNHALAHLLKAFDRLEMPVERVLDAYFHQCSLAMSCRQLARVFVCLSNRGISPIAEDALVTERVAKRINSLMLTSGMYDSVGNFAYRVGLPAKSGVGGGIVAVVPGRMCVAVWSPGLDLSGNSVVGVRALEEFTEVTGLSVF